MDWFENLWNDDSFWPYRRDNIDALVYGYGYIKESDKSQSANSEKTIADMLETLNEELDKDETEGGKNMNRKETTNKNNRKSPDFRRFIKKVKFNPPATIVFWTDDTKTVVKCKGEDYDPEKGLAMCISKKFLGDKGNYYEVFKKWLPKEDDSDVVQKVLEHIKPQTFEFELKPIDINQRLFEVLTSVPGKPTIQFNSTKKPDLDKKSVDKEKEESKPHSCHTCKFYDVHNWCMNLKICVAHNQWAPKDE